MRNTVLSKAPAKVNLALSVGPPIDSRGPTEGMHPICSWMVTTDLYDELSLTRLEDDRLSRYAILWHADARRRSDINWSITRDLAVRAHLALETHVGRSLPLQLKLEKRIPVGGGLGGGSSDAAAMLRGVNQLFELGLTLDELAVIGQTLGSDVPFLVRGGSAVVSGLGDAVHQHNAIVPMHLVLIFPEAMCPTARVYGQFDQLASANGGAKLQVQAVHGLAERGLPDSGMLFNDLAEAALLAAPALADDIERVNALTERRVHVTGSGSTLFIICDDDSQAHELAESIEHSSHLPAVAVQTCES